MPRVDIYFYFVILQVYGLSRDGPISEGMRISLSACEYMALVLFPVNSFLIDSPDIATI